MPNKKFEKKEFIPVFILFILILFIPLKSFGQTISFNQSFSSILFYSNTTNTFSFGALEKSNIILRVNNENFVFYGCAYFFKYELLLSEITKLKYSFYINQLWLRIPFDFLFIEAGIKSDFDIEQISIDLFAPYGRLIFQNFFGANSSLNRWQLSFKMFLSESSIFNLKWYIDSRFTENSQNILLFNFYNFFDPFQIELFGIYYQISEKSRFGFSIKFPFVLNWFLSSCFHFYSNLIFNYFETKIQASYSFSNFSFSIFWYYTSYVFSFSDFINILTTYDLISNLDELLTLNNNIFSINFNYSLDPFFSINFSSIFLVNPFDIFFNLTLNFKFSYSLNLKITYLKNIFEQENSTIHICWSSFMSNFSDLLIIELSFNM